MTGGTHGPLRLVDVGAAAGELAQFGSVGKEDVPGAGFEGAAAGGGVGRGDFVTAYLVATDLVAKHQISTDAYALEKLVAGAADVDVGDVSHGFDR